MISKILNEVWINIKKYIWYVILLSLVYGIYICENNEIYGKYFNKNLYIAFKGFQRIDKNLVMSIYINIPICIYVYIYVIDYISNLLVYEIMKRKNLFKVVIELLIKIILYACIYYMFVFLCIYIVTMVMGKSYIPDYYKFIPINNALYFKIIATAICYILGTLNVYIIVKDKIIGFVVPLIIFLFSNIIAATNYHIGMFLFGTQANMMICEGYSTIYILIVYCVVLSLAFIIMVNKNREFLLCEKSS